MSRNKEYAKALFMLACEQNKTEQIHEELQKIKEILLPLPEYLDFLDSPVSPLSERLSAIDKAFIGYDVYLLNFFKLVCENGHAKNMIDYIDDFAELKESLENSIAVSVTSAIPLSSEQKKKLEEKLSLTHRKKVLAAYTVDPALLGGVRVDIDGITFDGTLEKKLSLYKGVMNG